MMILCPHCATSYRLDAGSIGEAGRQVRCVRCLTVWFAVPEMMPEAAVARQQTEQLATQLASAAADLAPAEPAIEIPAALDIPTLPERAESAAGLSVEAAPISADPPAESVPESVPAAHQEPEQIDVSPSIVPPIEQLAALPTALPEPDDESESFAARRERLQARRKKERGLHMPSTGATIFILVLVIGGLLGWRKTIVRYAPQTASLYAMIGMPVNLRGVVFDNIKTTRDAQDGVPVLVVEGAIDSMSNLPIELPRLRFAVRNAAGQEIYSWTAMPPRSQIAGGERLAFRSRLASPPADAHDVTVRFFTRHDVVAGVR